MNEFDLLGSMGLLVAYFQLLLGISIFVERTSEVLFETADAFGLGGLFAKSMPEKESADLRRFTKRFFVFLVAVGYSASFNINFPLFELPAVLHVGLGALLLSFGAEFLHAILAFLEKAKESLRQSQKLQLAENSDLLST